MLTKGSTALLTKTGDAGTISADSLVKIYDPTAGTTTEPIGWNTAFNQIQPGQEVHLYQNVTLTNTVHYLPAENCTINGNSHELHYTENGQEKALILDADITFKNIKLFNGLNAWGHAVVFESDVVLSDGYDVWGGEFRDETTPDFTARPDYVVGNSSITIKGGTFDNIYGGNSGGIMTGSTYVDILGGTFNNIYGGSSYPDSPVKGDTHVTISGGTINGNLFGASLYSPVEGTANLTISGNATLNGFVFGGSNAADATVKNINVSIEGGTFYNWIFGGNNLAPGTETITMDISGGTFNSSMACGGYELGADCQNTSLTISGGTFNKWVAGGGHSGPVAQTAKTEISGGTFDKNIYGGGYVSVCGNTDLTISNVSLGYNTWVYGGGEEGSVSGTAKVTVKSGTINKSVFGGAGGWETNAACGNTEVVVEGGQTGWVYGGGNLGSVTGTAKVTVSDNANITGTIFGGGWGENASCGKTEVTMSGGQTRWVYGGGEKGSVSGTAKVNISGNAVIRDNLFGGGDTGTCGNTEVVLTGGEFGGIPGGSFIYGGGYKGEVTGKAYVEIDGATIKQKTEGENTFGGTIHGGSSGESGNSEIGKVGSTQVIIKKLSETTQNVRVYGGGSYASVTGNTDVTIEDGNGNGDGIDYVYGSCDNYNSLATVGGNVNILIKGGTIKEVSTGRGQNINKPITINGEMNITIEGGTVTEYIKTGQMDKDGYKDCTLTIRNAGSESEPLLLPTVFGISEMVLDNSVVKFRNPGEPAGMVYGFVLGGEDHPTTISGNGKLLGEKIPLSIIGTNSYPADKPLIIADNLPKTTTFAGYKTAAGQSITYLPAYKAGNTYRIPAENSTLHTVHIQAPNAVIGTLTVKWGETELDDGDQVPAGTELTIATTAASGNTLTVKDDNAAITDGKLTVNADVNLTVAIDGSLNLADQTTDITISKEGDQWQYLASDLRSTSTTAFNGIVTGTLPNNKTILIDASAQGELIFDNVKVDAGSTGTAITIAPGADIIIKGSLEATTSDSSAPAIANNGSISTATGASIVATNSGDPAKGISVSDGATLLLTDGSSLTASGIDNTAGGTVVAQEGSTVSNSTSGGSDLLKTHLVTITSPGNGNTLTAKAGDIDITSGDKVTENTQLDIIATPATNYSLEKITVTPENGSATEMTNNGSYTMGTAAITIAASFKYNAPYIPPATTYYTVTLPTVEGATLSKQAGDHTVEEGYSFTFTITLDEDYSESVPVVTTDRGETVTPDANGRYKIGNVEENIVVSISGIVKNIPTGIEGVESGTKIWTANGSLFIRTSAPQQVQVISLAGSTVLYRNIPAGDTRLEGLTAGVYIVRLSEKTVRKIVIR